MNDWFSNELPCLSETKTVIIMRACVNSEILVSSLSPIQLIEAINDGSFKGNKRIGSNLIEVPSYGKEFLTK